MESQEPQKLSSQPEPAIESHELLNLEESQPIHEHETCPTISSLASVPQPCPVRVQSTSKESHGESLPSRPIPDDPDDSDQTYPRRSSDVNELRGNGQAHHPFRGEQGGPTVQRGCQRGGSEILSVVHPQICGVEQAGASRVPALSQPLCGEEGARAEWARPSSIKVQSQASNQDPGWHGTWEPIQWPIDDRLGSRGRDLGSNQCSGPDHRESQFAAFGCDRGCPLADHESAPSTDASDSEPQPCVADHATTLMLQRCLEEIQNASSKTDPTYLLNHEPQQNSYRKSLMNCYCLVNIMVFLMQIVKF